ncbi:hypothetical protein DKX38_017683 [Salix brachista]|uniref:Uncharacterized protein n=1 Tax=Salix brachista TaxID=2182728 RepID=A0A5N5KW01_9ROSI|nr:hypothetical protein DKX38_017683 [Salix brachista]
MCSDDVLEGDRQLKPAAVWGNSTRDMWVREGIARCVTRGDLHLPHVGVKGLPLPLWSVKGLSLAASMVGKPLSCDQQTHNCTKLEYARVCVEIDTSLPYVHSFEIESMLSPEPMQVMVEYEWKPVMCSKCSVFDHSCDDPIDTLKGIDQPRPAIAHIIENPKS